MVVMVFVLVILEEMVMMIMVVVGPMVEREIERGANMGKWVILLLGSLETGKCN